MCKFWKTSRTFDTALSRAELGRNSTRAKVLFLKYSCNMKTLHLEFDPTGDWSISSSARENNPDDWLPGQPLRFAVRGYAEYRGGSAHEKHWSSTLRITWNYGLERNVDDCDTGLIAVQDDLKNLIAVRNAPPHPDDC